MKYLIKKAKGFTLVELMVVIVIVGILAAVAIPKFLDASNKAKASEFPTQLTAIFTGEMAYNAENGSYTDQFPTLTSTAGVDIQTTSKWFSYILTANGTNNVSFHATAKVAVPFGGTAAGDTGFVDQTNTKVCSDNLKRYCPNWR